MDISQRNELMQEVIERILEKYLYHEQFTTKLKELIEIFPLTTDVNFLPATFVLEEKEGVKENE